ncbi:hypothetical protein CK203_083110 [Vitis vinifera]|uniref:DUF7138 domain-containing protein n=1 Tax=Vitis vinifera TaxID=29760 RepID=A0A438E9W3_VITVI|nr:hypothetical protein CK203_083110 [Vitis vinifera]
MMEINAGVSFPVVFFDGEREINIGDVVVFPSMEFKNFQSILSQKIGISPHQISIFLDCQRKSRSSMETRRRIPITGKVSFSAILREKDCFFLVVLKRSRRERRRKSRLLNEVEEEEENFTTRNTVAPPQKLHLLRRNQETTDQTFSGFIQREKYLRSTNLHSIPNENYDFPVTNNRIGRDVIVCEECVKAMTMGKPVPFHWCVYDAVTVGFRSPAGPIARPVKRSN